MCGELSVWEEAGGQPALGTAGAGLGRTVACSGSPEARARARGGGRVAGGGWRGEAGWEGQEDLRMPPGVERS